MYSTRQLEGEIDSLPLMGGILGSLAPESASHSEMEKITVERTLSYPSDSSSGPNHFEVFSRLSALALFSDQTCRGNAEGRGTGRLAPF